MTSNAGIVVVNAAREGGWVWLKSRGYGANRMMHCHLLADEINIWMIPSEG